MRKERFKLKIFYSASFLGFLLLLLNSSYLASFGTPSLFYISNVFIHILIGIGLIPFFTLFVSRSFADMLHIGKIAIVLLITGIISGLWLMVVGATTPNRWLLISHIVVTTVGSILLILHFIWYRVSFIRHSFTKIAGVTLAVALIFPVVVKIYRNYVPESDYLVQNPIHDIPTSMYEEGGGTNSPFFPSSAETATGNLIPTDFFLTSKTCAEKGCHPDVYRQWNESAHHFSSFNNQWYRKSVMYMQDVNGIQSSKWCGGCHDPAIMFNGIMDRPIRENMHTPAAQAGLACTACHSIERVKDTMGNGGYTIKYPPLHDIAASQNKVVRKLHNYIIKLDPEPHRRSFIKPFHRENTAEFCSTCHKVHLDKPVNNFRWFRGFNTYDQWQTSGVSHQGALSFYYPDQPKKCVDCHMPLVPSKDAGNKRGKIKSHRFIGANTALPYVNKHPDQLEAVTNFLQDDKVTIDIFALVNENKITAPIGQSNAKAFPGDDVRVDVVVRTRGVGHHFPAGTIDAFDIWLELKATDEDGKIIFWNGMIDAKDGKNGQVDPNAHFYKSHLIDEHGNHINKRNAWAARTILYSRTIPPGAADTVRYRLIIPEDCGKRITLQAKLNYRKFNWWLTQWSYAGVRDPDHTDFQVDKGYDNGKWVFTGDTSQVAGEIKEIPNPPIVVISEDQATLEIVQTDSVSTDSTELKTKSDVRDQERWNDYGIGLLRQGDLKGAEAAFLKVVKITPNYMDGYVNIARCRIKEGNHSSAEEVLKKAEELKQNLDPKDPNRAKVDYFYALTQKSQGRYDVALKHLRMASEQFPRDKRVRNEIGRLLYLERRYAEAVTEFQKTLEVDPEDVDAHYHLMLSYHALKDQLKAVKAQKLYLRFKLDESVDPITGIGRRANPFANMERQKIREHLSSIASYQY